MFSGPLLSPNALSGCSAFRASDVETARRETTSLLGGSHRLEPRGSARRLDAEFRAFALSDEVLLFACSYGASVELAVPHLPFTLLQTPIAGRSEVQVGSFTRAQDEEHGSIVDQGADFRMRFEPDTSGLGTAVRADALVRMVGTLLGYPVSTPVGFELTSALERPETQAVHQVVAQIVAQVDAQSAALGNLLARAQTVDHLLTQLLFGQHNNYSSRLEAGAAPPAPAHVRRVVDYIQANAHLPLRLADLVEISGVGARALQTGFRQFRATTPVRYLRDVRLERAHADLRRESVGTTTVTEIALRWGFGSLGRFAKAYRSAFGERPSETLLRR